MKHLFIRVLLFRFVTSNMAKYYGIHKFYFWEYLNNIDYMKYLETEPNKLENNPNLPTKKDKAIRMLMLKMEQEQNNVNMETTQTDLRLSVSEMRGFIEVLKTLNDELYNLDTSGLNEKANQEFSNIPLKYSVITKELEKRLTKLEEKYNC